MLCQRSMYIVNVVSAWHIYIVSVVSAWQHLLTFFLTPRHLIAIGLYVFGSWLQHKHLYILSRLRKNKSG